MKRVFVNMVSGIRFEFSSDRYSQIIEMFYCEETFSIEYVDQLGKEQIVHLKSANIESISMEK